MEFCCSERKGSVIKQINIPDFWKHVILELHKKKLNPFPSEPIKVDEYYAVDYVNKFYFGRVLEVKLNSFIKFKFLHSVAQQLDWPRIDDIDKYTFLVFCMGQFIWRAIGLLLLPSTRKLKKSFRQSLFSCKLSTLEMFVFF